MDFKTGVLITTFNRHMAVRMSLDSIISTVPGSTPILVIDDGSTDGAFETASKFSERCQVRRNEKNIGLCASSNVGIRELKSMGMRSVIRVNSDVLVTGNWYVELCGALEDKSVGVAGPVYSSFSPSRVWPNQSWWQRNRWGAHVRYKAVPCIVGHCIAISDSLISSGFHFDEAMYPVGPCDVDLCCYSRAHGYQNVVACDTECTIIPSQKSTKHHPSFDYERCFPEYQRVLRGRHGETVYDDTVAYQYRIFR